MSCFQAPLCHVFRPHCVIFSDCQCVMFQAPLCHVTGPNVSCFQAPLCHVSGPAVSCFQAPLCHVSGPAVSCFRPRCVMFSGPAVSCFRPPVKRFVEQGEKEAAGGCGAARGGDRLRHRSHRLCCVSPSICLLVPPSTSLCVCQV